MPKEFIGTFPQRTTLHKNFVCIPDVEDYLQAREKMWATYGTLWSFIYEGTIAAGVQTFKLTEVPFGTKNEVRDAQ